MPVLEEAYPLITPLDAAAALVLVGARWLREVGRALAGPVRQRRRPAMPDECPRA